MGLFWKEEFERGDRAANGVTHSVERLLPSDSGTHSDCTVITPDTSTVLAGSEYYFGLFGQEKIPMMPTCGPDKAMTTKRGAAMDSAAQRFHWIHDCDYRDSTTAHMRDFKLDSSFLHALCGLRTLYEAIASTASNFSPSSVVNLGAGRRSAWRACVHTDVV